MWNFAKQKQVMGVHLHVCNVLFHSGDRGGRKWCGHKSDSRGSQLTFGCTSTSTTWFLFMQSLTKPSTLLLNFMKIT